MPISSVRPSISFLLLFYFHLFCSRPTPSSPSCALHPTPHNAFSSWTAAGSVSPAWLINVPYREQAVSGRVWVPCSLRRAMGAEKRGFSITAGDGKPFTGLYPRSAAVHFCSPTRERVTAQNQHSNEFSLIKDCIFPETCNTTYSMKRKGLLQPHTPKAPLVLEGSTITWDIWSCLEWTQVPWLPALGFSTRTLLTFLETVSECRPLLNHT